MQRKQYVIFLTAKLTFESNKYLQYLSPNLAPPPLLSDITRTRRNRSRAAAELTRPLVSGIRCSINDMVKELLVTTWV